MLIILIVRYYYRHFNQRHHSSNRCTANSLRVCFARRRRYHHDVDADTLGSKLCISDTNASVAVVLSRPYNNASHAECGSHSRGHFCYVMDIIPSIFAMHFT